MGVAFPYIVPASKDHPWIREQPNSTRRWYVRIVVWPAASQARKVIENQFDAQHDAQLFVDATVAKYSTKGPSRVDYLIILMLLMLPDVSSNAQTSELCPAPPSKGTEGTLDELEDEPLDELEGMLAPQPVSVASTIVKPVTYVEAPFVDRVAPSRSPSKRQRTAQNYQRVCWS